MCGIFGWSARPGADRTPLRTVGAILAMANDGRGGHSWGVCADGKVKRGIGEMAAVPGKLAPIFASADTLMAHTRFATTGAAIVANAHPFRIGGLIGAHNGIVYNHDWLNRTYGRACAVDSMHIFHHLADGFPTEDIEAYGAIEWVDTEELTAVNLARFNGGELSIVSTEIGVVWSSDWSHLDSALRWSGLEWREFETAEGRIYSAKHGKLYDLAPIDISPGKPAGKGRWPLRWDDARKSAASHDADADRLPSRDDIDSAWEEWKLEEEAWEAERLRIDDEERELTEGLSGAMRREAD